MTKKLIEMVCEGNSSRSEITRLIGNAYLENTKNRDYEITSSGIYVNKNSFDRISNYSFKKLKLLLKVGINENFYDKERVGNVEYAIKYKDIQSLVKYLIEAGKKFQEFEDNYRLDVSSRLGIKGNFKSKKEQTEVNLLDVAIFAMDNKIKEYVEEVYSSVKEKPLIETIGKYATGNSYAEIKDEIINNSFEETYVNAIEKLKEWVPKALNKFIESRK